MLTIQNLFEIHEQFKLKLLQKKKMKPEAVCPSGPLDSQIRHYGRPTLRTF